MKNIIAFLDELKANNNKDWFDTNRKRYLELKEQFINFTEKLIEGISAFDPSVAGQKPKDCIFRINRDVRFSNDKSPYKTHFGAYITSSGRNSGLAGYYFHVEAHDTNYIGGHILAAGAHMLEPKELLSIRTEIMDDPDGFIACLKKAKGFAMDDSDKLKRMPKGFPEDFKYAEYLKQKNYSLMQYLTDEQINSPNLLELALGQFATATPLNTYLNRAIDYARKEM